MTSVAIYLFSMQRPVCCGGALAARRCLSRPGRPLGASLPPFTLVGLLFSGTTVMGLPTDGRLPGPRAGRPGRWANHLDSCRRTMSYVRRTTLYNTDVVHDVVRQARTTLYPYDVVRGARTTSYINVVRQARTTLQHTM